MRALGSLLVAVLVSFGYCEATLSSTRLRFFGFRSRNSTMPIQTSVATTPPTFSRSEKREMDYVWKQIRKSCGGCWSGGLVVLSRSIFSPLSSASLVPTRGGLNFRLQVATSRNSGSWSVWNLNELEDSFVIPLARRPMNRPWQLKVAVDDGLIVRVPKQWSNVPRYVWEVGFWSSTIRRTAVAEYRKGWLGGLVFKEYSLVLQEKRPRGSFVGNTTDADDAAMLSESKRVKELRNISALTDWKVVRQDRLDLQTMRRSRGRSADATNILDRWRRALEDDRHNRLNHMLPNGFITSVPTRVVEGEDNAYWYFGHADDGNRSFRLLELEYDGAGRAISATLHVLRKQRN